MPEIRLHPLASVFPEMEAEDYQKLKLSIQCEGLLEPIYTMGSDPIEIIDGRHRYRACMELGIEPQFVDFSEMGQNDAIAFVMGKNMTRRHLKPAQRAAIAVELEPVRRKMQAEAIANSQAVYDHIDGKISGEEMEAQWKSNADGREDNKTTSARGRQLPKRLNNGSGKMSENLAKEFDIGKRTYERVKAVKERDAELFARVKLGEVEAKTAYRQIQPQIKAEREAKKKAAKPRGKPQMTYYTLEAWKELSKAEKDELLTPDHSKVRGWNKQDNESIEWARISWNPVSGCLHNCSYCYARDIAERYYEQGFTPSLYPERLSAPYLAKVDEDKAAGDLSYRNVFANSMSDLFGRWVPAKWIEAVLVSIRDNPQWNFLMLTKFPKRMAEFDIPDNAWMGTTVDCQARVAAAEKAFAQVDCKVKWLSVEPMLEDIRFANLELFDWVVMGGSSASSQTPAWAPPFDWVVNLHNQARAAGCQVYQKTNLFSGKNGSEWMSRLREWPGIDNHESMLPDAFKYMKSIS